MRILRSALAFSLVAAVLALGAVGACVEPTQNPGLLPMNPNAAAKGLALLARIRGEKEADADRESASTERGGAEASTLENDASAWDAGDGGEREKERDGERDAGGDPAKERAIDP